MWVQGWFPAGSLADGMVQAVKGCLRIKPQQGVRKGPAVKEGAYQTIRVRIMNSLLQVGFEFYFHNSVDFI